MPKTKLFYDCAQLARSVAACGGAIPDSLGYLLSSHEVLIAPAVTERPETAIVDAMLDGSLTSAKLSKLLPVAARVHSENQYRGQLLADTERILVAQFHRELESGAANAIIESLRPSYDAHAEQIAYAKSLFSSESSAEHILASGTSELVEAWQQLSGHVQVVSRIASVVSQFGPRPAASFPLIREFAAGETFRLDNRAVMATNGGLISESAEFSRPSDNHKNSSFFRCGALYLHTIEEAQARHNAWAAMEFDRIHNNRGRGGRIEPDGTMVYDETPPNPFRKEEVDA